jgi:hypothetical protein
MGEGRVDGILCFAEWRNGTEDYAHFHGRWWVRAGGSRRDDRRVRRVEIPGCGGWVERSINTGGRSTTSSSSRCKEARK